MNKNKKIIAIAGTSISAGVLVIGGALALFTDSADRNTGGFEGNVDIEASEITLSNPDNINPGDNDPDLPDTYTPQPGDPLYNDGDKAPVTTTPHNLEFDITNNGNKSIRTRHTFVISVKDKDDNYLDARKLQLYEVEKDEKASHEKELATGVANVFGNDDNDGIYDDNGKVYIAADNTEYIDAAEIPEGTLIKAIRYRVTPDIFDGVGLQAETEDVSTVKRADDNTAATKHYLYKLGCDMETPNEYQGAKVTIEATFEALQFRNTTHNDWNIVATKTFNASIADSNVSAVSERNEN